MGILGKIATFETLRSLNSATFVGSAYASLGTPLAHPSVLCKIVNNSTIAINISFDGINDHDFIPANSFSLYDFGSDAQSTSGDLRLVLAQGVQVSARAADGAGAGTGLIFFVTIYQGR